MKTKQDFNLKLFQITEILRYGSLVRSWLLERIRDTLAEMQDFNAARRWPKYSGGGHWAVIEAIDLDIPTAVITASLQQRLRPGLWALRITY